MKLTNLLRHPESYTRFYDVTSNIPSQNKTRDYDDSESYYFASHDINNDGIKELCIDDDIETLADLKWLKNLKVFVLSDCNIKSLDGN